MWWKRNGRIERDLSVDIRNIPASFLGPGAEFQGSLRFEGSVRIEGQFRGDIESQSALVIGEQACVEGTVRVGTLVLMGTVRGEIRTAELLELRSSGKLLGSLATPALIVEEGGVLEGTCTMTMPQSQPVQRAMSHEVTQALPIATSALP